MKLGNMTVRRSRVKEDQDGNVIIKYCYVCEEEIEAHIEYYYFELYFKMESGGKFWGRKVHKECLEGYIKKMEDVRGEKLKKEREEKGIKVGGPTLGLSEDLWKKRYYQNIYLSRERRKLLEAYEEKDEDKIRKAKLRLAEIMQRFVDNKETWGVGELRLMGNNKSTVERTNTLMKELESQPSIGKLNSCKSTEDYIKWLTDE